VTNARPGGSISAFCEPVTTTSRPSRSGLMSHTPSAVMASTTMMVFSRAFVSAAMAS
jgi:hypothetical protein